VLLVVFMLLTKPCAQPATDITDHQTWGCEGGLPRPTATESGPFRGCRRQRGCYCLARVAFRRTIRVSWVINRSCHPEG
jgi:hypothetical protein